MKVWELLYDTLWEAGLLNQVGQASGGSTTTVVDSTLSLDTDVKAGGSILIFKTTDGLAPQGEVKRIASNTANTYTTAAFSAAVESGDQYAFIAKDINVYELIPMVNAAFRKLPLIGVADTSITTALSQREYTLPVAIKAGRICNVQIQTNTGDADDNRWSYLYDWGIQTATAGNTGLLILRNQPVESRTIKIEYMGQHPTFTALSDEIQESIPPGLARAALKFQLDLMRNEEAIASQDGYRDLYNAAANEFSEALRMWPIWKPPVVKPARTFGRS